MHRRLVPERPGRAEQPGMALVDLRLARQRIARMQVERNVESLHRLPERPVLRQVVIDHAVGDAYLREAVDERAAEAELADAAGELARGELGVLHRQRRERLATAGALAHLLGQAVVGAAR